MPAIWNLKKYDAAGSTINWAGDSHDAYSVIIDSALGLRKLCEQLQVASLAGFDAQALTSATLSCERRC